MLQTRRSDVRLRFLLVYASAWTPFAAVYAALLVAQGYDSPGAAIADGVVTVGAAAVPGAAVWWITRRIRWPARSAAVFFAAHTALAALYAALWVAMTYLWIAAGSDVGTAARFLQRAAGWQIISGVWLYAVLAAVFYAMRAEQRAREGERAAVLAGARLAEAEAERARMVSLRAEAELRALRARLNPHFLFNTLHSLSVLVRRDPDGAEEALERLGALLRYVLHEDEDGAPDDVTLEAELKFVRDYLALEGIRLGARLRVEECIAPDALACRLPALTLQPLVENAVRHAVAPRPQGGTVRIQVERRDGSVRVRVSDDGPGTTPAPRPLGGTPGLGLRTVERRLGVRFPGESRFAVARSPGHGFTVDFSFPVEEGL